MSYYDKALRGEESNINIQLEPSPETARAVNQALSGAIGTYYKYRFAENIGNRLFDAFFNSKKDDDNNSLLKSILTGSGAIMTRGKRFF